MLSTIESELNIAVRLGCLERVILTAVRLVGGIPRTGHVSAYMLDVLHLLQRIMFRIGAMVWRCIGPTSEIFAVPPRAPEVAVHSTHRNRGYSFFLLLLPSTTQARAFSVVGPSVEWASFVTKIAPQDSF